MKNAIIGGVVGLLFMCGGFFFGLKLKPLPVPKPPVVVAAPAPEPKDKVVMPKPGSPITIDALRKTSESMMSLNEALQDRSTMNFSRACNWSRRTRSRNSKSSPISIPRWARRNRSN